MHAGKQAATISRQKGPPVSPATQYGHTKTLNGGSCILGCQVHREEYRRVSPVKNR